jgi:hypothetical protein
MCLEFKYTFEFDCYTHKQSSEVQYQAWFAVVQLFNEPWLSQQNGKSKQFQSSA